MCDPRGIKDRKERKRGGREGGWWQAEAPQCPAQNSQLCTFVPALGPWQTQVITPFPSGWLTTWAPSRSPACLSSSLGTFRLCPLSVPCSGCILSFWQFLRCLLDFPTSFHCSQFFPWGGRISIYQSRPSNRWSSQQSAAKWEKQRGMLYVRIHSLLSMSVMYVSTQNCKMQGNVHCSLP